MAGGTIKLVPLASLVEDLSAYPRNDVDRTHVSDLAHAHAAGATFPPPVVDGASMRIVDGFHRVRMWRRVLGPEGSIEVELRTYDSELELRADAARLNVGHGLKLGRTDQIRVTQILSECGADESFVGNVLGLPVERVVKLRLRVATTTAREPVALKASVIHLSGKELTAAQARAHQSAPGTSYWLLARQITQAIAADLIDLSDERVVQALAELREALATLDLVVTAA